jgi:chemotaxis response regulator CheB
MGTANLRDFTSFLLKLCHLGLVLVKSPQIMQTGCQILTEAGHTIGIKEQLANWTAHIDETATHNQYVPAVSRLHFQNTNTVTPKLKHNCSNTDADSR